MRKGRSLLLMILIAAMMLTMLPQPAYAAISAPDTQSFVGPTNGQYTKPYSGGTWYDEMQGFRITVLDHAGQAAWTFKGMKHLDIIFGDRDLNDMNCYVSGNKYDASSRIGYGTLTEMKNAGSVAVYTKDKLYNMFAFGGDDGKEYYSKLPDSKFMDVDDDENLAAAIAKLRNLSYYLNGDTKTNKETGEKKTKWSILGTEVRDDFYGADEAMDSDSILYLILNMYTPGKTSPELTYFNMASYLWKPVANAHYRDGDLTATEKLQLYKGETNPVELMAKKEVIISVEPIIWNIIYTAKGTAWYAVYGTHTGIGDFINSQISSEEDEEKRATLKQKLRYGGWDTVLFGKAGRKAMITDKPLDKPFIAHIDAKGKLIEGSWNIVPPPSDKVKLDETDAKTYVTTEDVTKTDVGWAIHTYKLSLGKPNDSTHTYDSDNYPTKKYTEHQAPDPTKDSWTKDNIASLTPDLRYNIVKFYEREVLAADGTTNKDIIHVSTHTRNKTLPKIEIQDEEEAGGYKVVEWKWSADPIPAIKDGKAEAGATKWTDEEIAELKVNGASTKDTRVGLVDITNKENGKEDKNTVTTLYVRLRKAIEFPETHTLDDPTPSNGNSGDEKSPGAAPDPLAPYENPDMPEEEKKQLVHNIVKVYETKTIDVDGTETLSLDGIYTRTNTAGIITIEEEGHLTGK